MLTATPLAAPEVSAGPSGAPAVASLDDVTRRIGEFDASSADGDAVLAMMGAVEDAVRCLRGYATVLGARMEELHGTGSERDVRLHDPMIPSHPDRTQPPCLTTPAHPSAEM